MAAGIRATGFVCTRCRAITTRMLWPSRSIEASRPAYNKSIFPPHDNVISAPQSRSFHFSSPRPKKKLKIHEKEQERSSQPDPGMKKASEDPLFNFESLQESIAKAHSKLKEGLSKLKPGGTLNPELVENLKVKLKKDSKDTVLLGDVAQCVPRGRTLMVMATDEEYVKPISAAIYGSDLSLTPDKDPQNPLQLNIKMPAPTAESRENTVKEAVRIGETTRTNITQASRTHHKKLDDMKRRVRPDDFFKAREQMNKIVENANTETKRIVESAKKVLESR